MAEPHSDEVFEYEEVSATSFRAPKNRFSFYSI